MSDLKTFHRLLVVQLAQSAPARLRDALSLAEIRETLLPYRRFRGPLGVHMEEDYDALLLQLAAGDDSLAALDDATLLKLFQAERRSNNPDLAQLDLHGSAVLTLDAAHVARVLADYDAAMTTRHDGLLIIDEADHEAPDELPLDLARAAVHAAPSDRMPPPGVPQPAAPMLADAPVAGAAPAAPFCPFCGGGLPTGRAVRFCPHCGQNQKTMPCPDCGAEAEIGWKHCVACGCGLPSL